MKTNVQTRGDVLPMRNDSRAKPIHLSRVDTLEEYYNWLCDLIGLNEAYKNYKRLVNILYHKIFFWSVPNDDNRAFEGETLRERFCEENNIEFVYDYFDFSCSMLELLIALAFRCEADMADRNDAISMQEWFWKLISNANLDVFVDIVSDRWTDDEVDKVLDKIINRTYQRNGEGGLFPLRFSRKDQRKVELWYQMSSYLVENYYKDEIFL